MDLTYLPIVMLVAFIAGKLWSARRSPAQLAEAARALREDKGVLVDVRTPAEFARGHAENKKQLKKLGRKSRPVVVYCASGTRSPKAVRKLEAAGFTNVINIATVGNAQKLPKG